MGKLQEFQITLSENKLVYKPGDSISGSVKISTAQAIQCKAIKVNCNGFCGVSSKVNDTDWVEQEQYVNSSLSVADKGTLKQGEHTFPFKFLLPSTAPTSYEGPYGKILYKIRAFIDTPRFSKDYSTEKTFYMLNNLNLNTLPDIDNPNSASVTKNFSYMLVKNGTVVLKAKTDLRGYVPGQIINVATQIENKSGKSTGHVVASLIQSVSYNTKKPTHETRKVVEVEGAEVKAGKQAEWKEQIIVPPLPRSSLEGSNLIKINYFLQVSLKFPEMCLMLPIYIGNVAVDPTLQPSPSNVSKDAPVPTPRLYPATPIDPSSPAAPSESSSPNLPPRPNPKPAPRPRPRSTCLTPSAPPAEGLMGSGDGQSEQIPTKIHSQQQGPMSPHSFSYAPGLAFPQSANTPSAPAFCFSAGTTIPFFTDGNAPPILTTSPLILPPEYTGVLHPQEPPPSYEASFP